MKILTTILLVVAFIAGCGSATQQSDKSTEKEAPAELTELKLHVKGMTCEGCENAIIRSLDRIEGVYESDASHKDELVVIKYDPTTVELDHLTNAITRVGYEVVGEFEAEIE
jgi:copper chaperone CopZ